MRSTWTSVYEPLLGTRVEVRVSTAAGEPAAERAAGRVVSEMARLERVFTVFDDASELVRWRTGRLDRPGPELGEVLRLALYWHAASAGAFNVAIGELTARWSAAHRAGREPDRAELAAMAARLAEPPYAVGVDGDIERRGECAGVTLNAIAKGWIADRGAACGLASPGIESVSVNAGGDIAHRGTPALVVGIENPLQPYDNVAPLAVVALDDGGVATSGSVRRGVDIGGRWFGHVLDPRTGEPVADLLSVTAIAADAVTADVVATIVSVLGPVAGIRFVDALDAVECLTVDPVGRQRRSAGWDRAANAGPASRR